MPASTRPKGRSGTERSGNNTPTRGKRSSWQAPHVQRALHGRRRRQRGHVRASRGTAASCADAGCGGNGNTATSAEACGSSGSGGTCGVCGGCGSGSCGHCTGAAHQALVARVARSGPPTRVTACAVASAVGFVAAIAADMLPRVMAHGEEDHGTLVDLRELHGILLLAAWGLLIPVHVVLLLYYQWTDATVCKYLHVHPAWKYLYRLHVFGIVVYIAGFAAVLFAIEDDGGHELEAIEWQRQAHKLGGYAVGLVGLVQELLPKMFEQLPWSRALHKWNGRLLFVYVFAIQLWTGFILLGWPGLPMYLWLVWQGLLTVTCVGLGVASKACPRTPAESFEQELSAKLQRQGLEIINPFQVAVVGDGDSSGSDDSSSDSSDGSDDGSPAHATRQRSRRGMAHSQGGARAHKSGANAGHVELSTVQNGTGSRQRGRGAQGNRV